MVAFSRFTLGIWVFFLGVAALSAAPPGEEDRRDAEKERQPIVYPRAPEIFAISRLGAERGKTVEATILGQNLDGVTAWEFSGSGVEGKILKSTYLTAQVQLSVMPDAASGIHLARLLSPLGASNLVAFRVGDLPQFREQEPNNRREEAQRLVWPAVADGLLFPDEDTDFYRFYARSGQRVLVEVLAARSGSGLNAELYLLDRSGRRLSVGDDEEGRDPSIDYVVSEESDYFVVVRSVFNLLNISFPTGHPGYVYQLRISSPPQLASADPLRVRAGSNVEMNLGGKFLDSVQALEVSPSGVTAQLVEVTADNIRATLQIDDDARGAFAVGCLSPQGRSNPVEIVVDDPNRVGDEEPDPKKPHFALAPTAGPDLPPSIRGPDRIVAHVGAKTKIPVTVQWLDGLEELGVDIKLTVEGLPAGVQAEPVWAKIPDLSEAGGLEPITANGEIPPPISANVEIPLVISHSARLMNVPIRIKGEALVGEQTLSAREQVAVSVTGRYVTSVSGGFLHTLDHRLLSIVKPAPFRLQPEIGDERYPIRFTMQPGTNKILTTTVIAPEHFPAELQFTAENLPRGVTIQRVEAESESHQYHLHLQAAPNCETGWFPMVALIATTRVDGRATVVTAPYFGMAVQ